MSLEKKDAIYKPFKEIDLSWVEEKVSLINKENKCFYFVNSVSSKEGNKNHDKEEVLEILPLVRVAKIVDGVEIRLGSLQSFFSLQEAFERFTFKDGTPFGVRG